MGTGVGLDACVINGYGCGIYGSEIEGLRGWVSSFDSTILITFFLLGLGVVQVFLIFLFGVKILRLVRGCV